MANQIKKSNVSKNVATPKKQEIKAVPTKDVDLQKEDTKVLDREEVEEVLYDKEAEDAIYERAMAAVESSELVGMTFGYVDSVVPEKVAQRLEKEGIIVGTATQESGVVKTQISW